jgi:hypothetical protein
MNKPEIWIGARGWRHESWVGEFYPDDMPHDWWLAYYTNEFDTVLVPWDYLQNARAETLQAWLDEANEDFVFFIELPLSASKAQVETVLDALGPRVGGILLNDITSNSKIITDGIAAVDWLELAKARAPVAIDWGSLMPDSAAIDLSYPLGCYWCPEEKDLIECGGSLGIAELNSVTRHDPKLIKNLLENCRSVPGPTTIGLFFGGDAPRIDEMRNAIMILQMLG